MKCNKKIFTKTFNSQSNSISIQQGSLPNTPVYIDRHLCGIKSDKATFPRDKSRFVAIKFRLSGIEMESVVVQSLQ